MKYILLTIIIIIQFACNEQPATTGIYYIGNQTNFDLKIKAFYNQTQIVLLDSIVEFHRFKKIYTGVEGSGGHVNPSNFFTEFTVYAITAGGDSPIYQGVRNEDWETSNRFGYFESTLNLE